MKKITIQQILKEKKPTKLRALFSFCLDDPTEAILLKFNLWSRYFFLQYFTSKDADFHEEMDTYNLQAYQGSIDSFTNLAFRGAAKTSRVKLFIAYMIANDRDKYRRYIKVLSEEGGNSRQIVTDVYNMLVSPRVRRLYPEIFQKTAYKREERMSSFTTATGIKLLAGSVGTDQRGALQEEARPDLILFEDFETRKTLRSAKITQAIWDNMEEARTSLAKEGSCIYNGNYISEMGNVHRLVEKRSERNIVMITPILKNGKSTWDRYTLEDIEQMRKTDDDFEGERLCEPSASKDILFDREMLDRMEIKQPIKEIANFKIYNDYDPSHRYGSGHDVAGGVGLDSSTSVFIDFSTIPAQVVGTFQSNTIQPESFGDEVYAEGCIFGQCIQAIENNKFDQAVLKARMLGANLYQERSNELNIRGGRPRAYGWNTTSLSKSKMLLDLRKAIADGLISLNDEALIKECKSYSRNDMIEKEQDARLTTRHHDILMACCIAWQMKDHATIQKQDYNIPETEPLRSDIGI